MSPRPGTVVPRPSVKVSPGAEAKKASPHKYETTDSTSLSRRSFNLHPWSSRAHDSRVTPCPRRTGGKGPFYNFSPSQPPSSLDHDVTGHRHRVKSGVRGPFPVTFRVALPRIPLYLCFGALVTRGRLEQGGQGEPAVKARGVPGLPCSPGRTPPGRGRVRTTVCLFWNVSRPKTTDKKRDVAQGV